MKRCFDGSLIGLCLAAATLWAAPARADMPDPDWVILEDGVRHGDLNAFVEKGDRLMHGDGVPANPARALELWAAAALDGHPEALARVARAVETGQGVPADPSRAMGLWVRAERAGSAEAKIRVAQARLTGQGLGRQPGEGIRLLAEASALGHPEAQRRMAWHLEHGHYVERNLSAAEDLYRRAARTGHAGARNDLGALLAERGDAADRPEAWAWFHLAADGGVAEARRNRDDLQRRMSRRERGEARALAEQWRVTTAPNP